MMFLQIGIYVLIAIVTSLLIAAYDGGQRWGAGTCLFLGATWPISLSIMLWIVIRRKIGGR
jgi:hypothetical protein